MDHIEAKVKKIDVLPMVKYYMDQLDLYSLFEKYIPKPSRCPVEPAQILTIMVMNIICASNPLYKIEEWLAEYTDGLSEEPLNASDYNDDQLAKNLDRLFGADRNSLMAELSVHAIQIFNLETNRIHNDSTSITFMGNYKDVDPQAVKLKHGFNKDHRPDCKQIVFGLNITADGHVPLSFQLFDGNKTDDATHIPNWEGLRRLLEKEDFVYVADCKVCSVENMGHIDANNGKFITIVPKNRASVKAFYEKLRTEPVQWSDAYRTESTRKRGEFIVYRTYEHGTTEQGYRLIWVHSSAKQQQDEKRRKNKIEKIDQELQKLSTKLNRYRLKTKGQIETAIAKACKGGRDFFQIQLIEDKQTVRTQMGPGRPGPKTVYQETEEISYRLHWEINEQAIVEKSKTDGIFPLITNTDMQASQVLRIYKEQPYLEKRMYTTKSILGVAPVFLKLPKRIEAITFLYFIGLMLVSLMERNIRKNMVTEKKEKLPILPNGMNTKRPTWNNLKYFFRNVHLSLITDSDKVIKTTVKGITQLHELVIQLLAVPLAAYTTLQDQWWNFQRAKTPILENST